VPPARCLPAHIPLASYAHIPLASYAVLLRVFVCRVTDSLPPYNAWQRLKNTIRDTLARVVGGGNAKGMMIISTKGGGGLSSLMRGGLGGGVTVRSRGFGRKGKNGKTVINFGDDDDEDEDDEEDDDEDEEGGAEDKELASRTLLAVRWLHAQGRLADDDKRRIVSDVIKNVADEDFSRAEVQKSILSFVFSPALSPSDPSLLLCCCSIHRTGTI